MNNLKVILVDDEKSSILGLEKLIPWSKIGYDLAGTFTCGDDAISFIENNHVDVVCTDICMPKPDGLDIVEICNREYPHIKVLLFSAFRDFEYAQRALRFKNVCDYLTKPIDYKALIEVLKKIASNSVSKTSVFSSVEDIDKRISFFSNLLCGNITTEKELVENLKELKISTNFKNSSCNLVVFHINDFQDFLKKTSKYSSAQLYYAISNFYPFETDGSYFSLALYSLSNIMWIIIHNQELTDAEKTTEKFISDMKEHFSSVLHISVDVTRNQSISLSELLRKHSGQLPDINDSSNDDVIARAMEFINNNWNKNISLDDVAQHVFMCSAYFSSYFKKKTGERFIDKLTEIRMNHATELLLNPEELSLVEICEKIGYNHVGYFYRKFKSFYGVTPTEYRKQNQEQ